MIGSEVLTVHATDADAGGLAPLTYSIKDYYSAARSVFAIDPWVWKWFVKQLTSILMSIKHCPVPLSSLFWYLKTTSKPLKSVNVSGVRVLLQPQLTWITSSRRVTTWWLRLTTMVDDGASLLSRSVSLLCDLIIQNSCSKHYEELNTKFQAFYFLLGSTP